MAEELKLKYLQSEAGSSAIRNQLNAYAGEGVDVEALERALTLVKRRGESIAKLDFLVDPDDGVDDGHTSIGLKRKIQQVQVDIHTLHTLCTLPPLCIGLGDFMGGLFIPVYCFVYLTPTLHIY